MTRPHRHLAPWSALLALCALSWASIVHSATGSYATSGTGTYAQSLWWLDFSSYSDTAASAGGQAMSFVLPNGAGTLSTTLKRTGGGTLTAVAEPAWTGGAFGHGAYNGLSGDPIFYWINQTGTGTISLTSMGVKDAAGNARTFSFYAADGENTNSPETIGYSSTAVWSLLDSVNYYPGYTGGVPTLAGVGTSTVTESGTTGTDSSFNGSIILATQNPTQVSVALGGNEGALVAISMPTVTLNVSIATRAGAADQFTGAVGYTSPSASLKTASTAGTATTATTGTVSIIGTNSVTLSASLAVGSSSSLSYYTSSIACTNSGPGAAAYGGVKTVLPAGSGFSFAVTPQTGDNITCTLTLTPVPQPLNGTVYADTNHNGTLDGVETGTGLATLYMKIAPSSSGVCQNPATAAAAVNATTGAFSFAAVNAGTYCLTLTNSSALTNTTAYLPAGWIGTEASSGVRTVTTSASPSQVQNFGLYNGSQISLAVFADTGMGGGTANDGVQSGGEPGLSAIGVRATISGTVIANATTNSSGIAALWIPATAGGVVTVTPTPPSGDLPTGGSAGTTGGAYVRPSVSFTVASGNTYTGMAFGMIPPNSLASSGSSSAQAGTAVFYPHTFVAGSAGQVTFSIATVASPALSGWTQVLYVDTTCSGQFASADTVINAPVTVTAAQTVCVLLKQFVPAGAPPNSQNKATLNASLAYSGNAAPTAVTASNVDVTTVVTAGGVQFTKQVQNLSQAGAYGTRDNALPGNLLQYQLTVVNQGTAAMSTVVVNDATPAYTTYVSAACPAALPNSLTSCSIGSQPAAGAQGPLQWVFQGTLAPGAQTTVTYQVAVVQ